MTVYNINLGIGWASGVEYAQAYRTDFQEMGQRSKNLFYGPHPWDNIEHMTSWFSDDESSGSITILQISDCAIDH